MISSILHNLHYNLDFLFCVSGYGFSIQFPGIDKLAVINNEENLLNIIKQAKFKIPKRKETIDKYKYPYSNNYKKQLHQIVFDYYFGEDMRKNLYEKDYIIEHLDNDGFNCDISNLFILKKIKNTYKGWHLDKILKKGQLIAGFRIYHVLENRTFQITIAFNEKFKNDADGSFLESIRLLYDYNYEIVLQDAELIFESIIFSKKVDLNEWRRIYRFRDIRVSFANDITLSNTEEELPFGSIIKREDGYYIKLGVSSSGPCALVSSISYDKNWNSK